MIIQKIEKHPIYILIGILVTIYTFVQPFRELIKYLVIGSINVIIFVLKQAIVPIPINGLFIIIYSFFMMGVIYLFFLRKSKQRDKLEDSHIVENLVELPKENLVDKTEKPKRFSMVIEDILWEFVYDGGNVYPFCNKCQTPLKFNEYHNLNSGYYDTSLFCDTCKGIQHTYKNSFKSGVVESIRNQIAGELRRRAKDNKSE